MDPRSRCAASNARRSVAITIERFLMIPRGAKRRITTVVGIYLLPVVFLCGVGAYHLYATGWSFVAWGGMAACFLLAYGLGWYWTRKGGSGILPKPNFDDPMPYWTDRDKAAWQAVEKYAAEARPISKKRKPCR